MEELHRVDNTLVAGAPLAEARAAMILVHGRGGTAESMLPLANAIGRGDIAYRAPQALGNTWYPYPFLAPLDRNEPYLSSALAVLEALVAQLADEGVATNRVAIVGFSQGACLATEFAARRARRYGFIAALTGGLIGPPGTPRTYTGSLEATPVFLGCSDIDPHIPLQRVDETADVLAALGADVDKRIYADMGHVVNDDEIDVLRALLDRLASG